MLSWRKRSLIFGLAACAYLPGFWWGAPHATADDRRKSWGVDDEPPLGPLAQLHDMMTPGLAPDANLGYPMLHSYMVLGAYAPYVGWLYATGKLASPGPEYPYGFSDPVTALRNLAWLAHFLSVLLGAGVVLAAYEIGRTLWGEREGRWAAAFALLAYPMFYYSRTSNVDVPVLFFTAWALVPFARALASGVTARRIAAFGALAGLALATKEPVFAFFIGLPLALLFPRGEWKGARSPSALAKMAVIALVCAFAAYAVGSGMLIDYTRWSAHIDFASTRTAEVAEGTVAFVSSYPRTLAGHWGLAAAITARLRDMLTLPGLALGVLGLVLVLRRQDRQGAWIMAGVLTYLLVIFLVVRMVQLRFIIPAGFVLAVFAGYAAVRVFEARHRAARVAGTALVGASMVIAALWALDLTWAMLRDSRYDAGRWFADVARPGDRLEYFGAAQKNPPLPAAVKTAMAVEYLGGNVQAPRDSATVQRIREGWMSRRPRFILLIPDFTSRNGEPYPASCPPQIFDDLESGRLGYVRARLFENQPLLRFFQRPSLDYPVVNPPIRVFVPAEDPLAAREGA